MGCLLYYYVLACVYAAGTQTIDSVTGTSVPVSYARSVWTILLLHAAAVTLRPTDARTYTI